MLRIAINGYGRIGRALVRALFERGLEHKIRIEAYEFSAWAIFTLRTMTPCAIYDNKRAVGVYMRHTQDRSRDLFIECEDRIGTGKFSIHLPRKSWILD